MELAEFMVKIIVIVTLTIGIIGMMVQATSFEGVTKSDEQERLAIDFAQASISAPCLTANVGGEARKGLLDSAKLNSFNGKSDFCIQPPGLWSVEVTDGKTNWKIGATVPEQGVSQKTLPVAIKSAGGTVPAKLTVRLNTVYVGVVTG